MTAPRDSALTRRRFLRLVAAGAAGFGVGGGIRGAARARRVARARDRTVHLRLKALRRAALYVEHDWAG